MENEEVEDRQRRFLLVYSANLVIMEWTHGMDKDFHTKTSMQRYFNTHTIKNTRLTKAPPGYKQITALAVKTGQICVSYQNRIAYCKPYKQATHTNL